MNLEITGICLVLIAVLSIKNVKPTNMVIPNNKRSLYIKSVSFKTIFPCGVIQCAKECLVYKLCMSISVVDWTCYINYGSNATSPEKMAEFTGAVYLDIADIPTHLAGSCQGHTCKNNERCIQLTKSNSTCNTDMLLDNLCPDGWHSFGTSCYYIAVERVRVDGAMNYCLNMAGVEAAFETMEELLFINSRLQIVNITQVYQHYSLGLEKINNSTFIWRSTRQPLTINNMWLPGQPDGYRTGENCTEIRIPSKLWNDIQCSSRNRPICEKSITLN